jgi:CBS-domain-containing membrane protein
MITEEDLVVRNANLHLPTLIEGLYPVRGQRRYDEEVRHMLATRAREVMNKEHYTIAPDADIADAATLMFEKHANPVPVVDRGRLVGIISRFDIIRLMVREESAPDNAPTS